MPSLAKINTVRVVGSKIRHATRNNHFLTLCGRPLERLIIDEAFPTCKACCRVIAKETGC